MKNNAKSLLALFIAFCGVGQTGCTPDTQTPAEAFALGENSVDVGYLRSMLRHHEQALFLAQIAQDAEQTEVRSLAWAMANAQSKEIGRIHQWLADHGHSPAPKGLLMQWVEDLPESDNVADQLFRARCRANGNTMPGNISLATFKKVSDAQPKTKGSLFLEIMINHHQAAVDMSNFARRHVQSSFVKSLSQTIARDQQLEVGRMQTLLTEIGTSKPFVTR